MNRPSTAGSTALDDVQTVNLDGLAAQPTITDDLLESPLNEASKYNFWESINMPE
jgi:hypothetical protein